MILREALYPLVVVATQAVSTVAIAPVLLLLLGAGEVSKIVVAFSVAFFPIVVDNGDQAGGRPTRVTRSQPLVPRGHVQDLVKVRFPTALPFFFSRLKVAVTLSMIGAVVGEFVGSDRGLGYAIVSATSYWKSNLAFGAMGILALMAIALFALVELVERLVCPWARRG